MIQGKETNETIPIPYSPLLSFYLAVLEMLAYLCVRIVTQLHREGRKSFRGRRTDGHEEMLAV